MRCLDPVKVTEILRLSEMSTLKLTLRQIGESVGCSKTTVGEIKARCRECGLAYEDARQMTTEQINALIYPESFGKKPVKDEPDWQEIHNKLKRSNRLNLQYLWEEYRTTNPEGLSYSRFCFRYNEWKDASGKNVVFAQEREPGKEMFIDWIGDKLDCVVDASTGEIHTAHFFVTTLGDSSFPFVEAFPDETQINWLQGHIDAFHWYGALPRILVPDNCKTAINKAKYYDPTINASYLELSRYYNVAIIPARVRKPRDKATVESGVGWLETWLLEWLSQNTYFSFEALNHDIKERIQKLSKRPFQKRPGSRKSVYDELDKPAMRPLPSTRFEVFETKETKVPSNYHVEWEGFYYSVPYQLYKQPVKMHIHAKTIAIYNENHERVALHARKYSGKRYVTIDEHMPENHKHQKQFNHYDGSYYRFRANAIGSNAFIVIDMMLTATPIEEQAYRSCMGLIQSVHKYGDARVEGACKKALALHSANYTTVINILKNGQDKQLITNISDADTPTPQHENLRTAEWS